MSSICQINNKLYIDGKEIEKPKSIFFKNTVSQIDNKIYINGKELKEGEWKYTLRAIFSCMF